MSNEARLNCCLITANSCTHQGQRSDAEQQTGCGRRQSDKQRSAGVQAVALGWCGATPDEEHREMKNVSLYVRYTYHKT